MNQIDFTGRNIEVTDAMKTHASEKLQRILRRNQKITRIHVTFHIDGPSKVAEANMLVNGTEIHARGDDRDMYVATDSMVNRLISQLSKLNEKSK